MMTLMWNIKNVTNCDDVCFEHKTVDDLEEGQTLYSIVNEYPRPLTAAEREKHLARHAENPDFWGDVPTEGELDTVRMYDGTPYPWFFPKNDDGSEDSTRIMRMSPVTYVLIQNGSTVGITEITEENWEEVWTRLNIMQHTFTYGLGGSGKPNLRGTHTMPDVVKAHIGLRLPNTSRMTSEEFNEMMGEWLRQDAESRLREIRNVFPGQGGEE